jgi:ketosteroid isomerase-like protein
MPVRGANIIQNTRRECGSPARIYATPSICGTLEPMIAWAVRSMIRRNVQKLNDGDVQPLLSSYADDVHFVFPGDTSWAIDAHGKAELEAWLQRFVEVGMQFEPREIVVSGWPWDLTICVQFRDHALGPDGEAVYENDGVILGRVSWGKIKSYRVYEDTEKVRAFDEYLASRGAAAR